MTTSQITTIVRNKLLEVGTDILSDETVLLYTNLAYIDIWKRLFVNSDIATGTATFVSGEYTLPSTVGTLYGSACDTNGNTFEEVSIEDFARETLAQMVTVENGLLKVFPVDTTSLTYKYFKKPEDLSASVNPTIDSYFHECLIMGALARCHEDLQDEELSTYYSNKFETELNKRIEHQSAYEETNQRGATMFVEQTFISEV